MKCPHCGCPENRVTDTRDFGDYVTRYRHCRGCSKSFATRESLQDQSSEPKAAGQPKRVMRYRPADPADIPVGVCAKASELLLQWWNESRWSKHRGKATWTRAAFVASAQRLADLRWEFDQETQIDLATAGVEFGWQSLKPEYISSSSDQGPNPGKDRSIKEFLESA